MDPEEFFKEKDMNFEQMLCKMYNLKEMDMEVHSTLKEFKKPQKCSIVQKKMDNTSVTIPLSPGLPRKVS